MSEWVSVEDRLPGNGVESVIAHFAPGWVEECFLQDITSTAIFVTLHPEQFTHWMPLPEPPK